MARLDELSAFQALRDHADVVRKSHLRALFANDPTRFERYSARFDDLLLDYSKNWLLDDTMGLLLKLARAQGVEAARDAMFAGAPINQTEGRAVLHTLLRAQGGSSVRVDGEDVMPGVQAVLKQMAIFTEEVRSGRWIGYTGRRITDVVNIGIGGSDLGPAMVAEALEPYAHQGLRLHFVANIDGAALHRVCKVVDPATTLFIIASKSFTTQETLTNARSARTFLLKAGASQADVAKHFVALSTNRDAVEAFGIDPKNMFPFWSWVGGRYSIWSAIGLSVALSVGMERFQQMLQGAHSMDVHFQGTPLDQNLPVIMALLGVWYRNVFGLGTHAVIPYDQSLHRFAAYLQQADMESNGKSICRDGTPVTWSTGPVVFGEPGTNAQHAFFQLLHQGTDITPVDFIIPVHSHAPYPEHHGILLANCFAQSQAMMQGKTAQEVRAELVAQGIEGDTLDALVPHRQFEGNRPSNTLVFDRLDPFSLGRLIALYEHKIFVQGVLWDIYSFDQWGVELGKQLAKALEPAVNGGSSEGLDASTQGLLAHLHLRRSL